MEYCGGGQCSHCVVCKARFTLTRIIRTNYSCECLFTLTQLNSGSSCTTHVEFSVFFKIKKSDFLVGAWPLCAHADSDQY